MIQSVRASPSLTPPCRFMCASRLSPPCARGLARGEDRRGRRRRRQPAARAVHDDHAHPGRAGDRCARCSAWPKPAAKLSAITAPNREAARALKEIRAQVTAAGWGALPLRRRHPFSPRSPRWRRSRHVEKVRVNPGNYADKKKFAVKEYTDHEYDAELQRLHDAFSPLVKRAKELGRALRIGTNHGSLSDRLMNRYGDTPLGQWSTSGALEFIRICESHGFRDIVLSMKASNPPRS